MGEVLSPKRSELNEIVFLEGEEEEKKWRGDEKKRGEDSVDVKLVAEMEEKTSRLTGETTSGSKGKVGGNQKIVHVICVNFAGDGGVVAGGAGVLHDGSGVGGEPENKTEGGRVHSWVRGAQVVEGEQSFGDLGDFGEVEWRSGSVADGDEGSGLESGRGDEVVMRGGRVLGGAERAGVDDGALEGTS
jgi:hypothetical protein